MNVFSMFITTPLGYILNAIYSLVQSYGVAILIFTVVVKLIMLPLSAKQQKSMHQIQKIQPQLEKIQKKYANDKNKLQQETVKIYQENKVNPAGGCLPLLIQLPIIIGLYQVIRDPLKYVQNVSEINYIFLGLNLADTPKFDFIDGLWLIPLLSALTAYLSSIITRYLSGNTTANDQMKSMNIIMPLMSGYFCFIMPAGVGLYWIASNVVQIIQQTLLTLYYKRKDEKETNE